MQNSYAQALYRTIEGGKNPRDAVRALKDLLAAQGRIALAPRIAHAFRRIAQRNALRNDVVLTVAQENDANRIQKQIKNVISELVGKGREVKTRTDDGLIGGWRLEGNGTLIDNSYKKQLLSMYNRITNI